MSVGDNIRRARINNKLSQKELADELSLKGYKVGNTTISNWESGFSKPDPDTISALCEILDTDANYLLDFSKEENNSEIDNLLFSKAKDLSDEDKMAVIGVIEAIKKKIDNENL